MKYLVIADTYTRPYGCEITLFGIFDTEEEAVEWIIKNPRVRITASESWEEDEYEEYFDFFEDYDEERGGVQDYRRGEHRFVPMTKEEFILKRRNFIHKFDGTPECLGGYAE